MSTPRNPLTKSDGNKWKQNTKMVAMPLRHWISSRICKKWYNQETIWEEVRDESLLCKRHFLKRSAIGDDCENVISPIGRWRRRSKRETSGTRLLEEAAIKVHPPDGRSSHRKKALSLDCTDKKAFIFLFWLGGFYLIWRWSSGFRQEWLDRVCPRN